MKEKINCKNMHINKKIMDIFDNLDSEDFVDKEYELKKEINVESEGFFITEFGITAEQHKSILNSINNRLSSETMKIFLEKDVYTFGASNYMVGLGSKFDFDQFNIDDFKIESILSFVWYCDKLDIKPYHVLIDIDDPYGHWGTSVTLTWRQNKGVNLNENEKMIDMQIGFQAYINRLDDLRLGSLFLSNIILPPRLKCNKNSYIDFFNNNFCNKDKDLVIKIRHYKWKEDKIFRYDRSMALGALVALQ